MSRLAIPVSVVLLLSVVFVSHVWARQALENPQPDSFQSGIGVISGWACDARRIEIRVDSGPDAGRRLRAGTGTLRPDTRGACGDTNNGFGLLYNWNRLGDGIHTVTAYADGVEFANVQIIVTTLGEEFLRGVTGDYGDVLRWQEAQQNFVIGEAAPSWAGGRSGQSPHVLENPQPGSTQSGIGVISGWACNAQRIEISVDSGPDAGQRLRAGTGTLRLDTRGVCGDTNNGFGLLYNWNRLGDGVHTVTAYADGVEFARVDISVTTLGAEFRRDISLHGLVPDFPVDGIDTRVQWQEAQQNFVITAKFRTPRIVAVTPSVQLPSNITIPNIHVSSFLSDTAEVRTTRDPSLLLAEDAGGTVLLALANKDGGLLGEQTGKVRVSLDSTAVALVGLAAGIAIPDMTALVAQEIQDHPQYGPLWSALYDRLRADRNFLDRLYDDPATVRLVEEVAADITPEARFIPQPVGATSADDGTPDIEFLPQAAGTPSVAAAQANSARSPEECEAIRLNSQGELALDVVGHMGLPVEGIKTGKRLLNRARDIPQDYAQCVENFPEIWKRNFPSYPPYPFANELDGVRSGYMAKYTQEQDRICNVQGVSDAFHLIADTFEEGLTVIKDFAIGKYLDFATAGKAWLVGLFMDGYAKVKGPEELQDLVDNAQAQGCENITVEDIYDGGSGAPVTPERPWCHLSLTTQAPNGFTGSGDQERDECIDLTSARARSEGWQTCGDVANHRWSDDPICPSGWGCQGFVPNDYRTRAECEQGAREWRGGGEDGGGNGGNGGNGTCEQDEYDYYYDACLLTVNEGESFQIWICEQIDLHYKGPPQIHRPRTCEEARMFAQDAISEEAGFAVSVDIVARYDCLEACRAAAPE